MASFNELNVITDPDQLSYQINTAFGVATSEIIINTATLTLSLKVTGNLTSDGATIKAVYSKLKDAWNAESTLSKFKFPMGPITDEQYEMVNGWNWDKVNTSGADTQSTVELIRTGGWSVVNTSGNVTELWSSVVTLGSLGATDQVYFQQVSASTAPVDFKLTGKVNQAIQILNDPNGDGSYADGYDRRSYLKLFVREWQKIYAQSEINDIGVSTMTYQAYRFPLTNSSDLKVTHTELDIDSNSDGTPDSGVYQSVTVTYLRHSGGGVYNVRGDFSPATVYSIGDVVKDTGNSRWYKCILGYISTGTLPSANATNWSAYEGERLIGSSYYPYTVIIDGDTTVGTSVSGSARTNEIYEAVQYLLRQDIDIDSSTGTVTGKTASGLLRFVGDTLVTASGVYIDSFNTQDTNSITFTDSLGNARTFPYVAAITINFGENLQNDQYSKFWLYFTNANGNTFGSLNAIVVKDKDTNDISGLVNPAWPTKRSFASFSFNYDSNVQGGRTAGTDADVTLVAIGLGTGQYVSATGTISRSTANAISAIASLERNYSVGSV